MTHSSSDARKRFLRGPGTFRNTEMRDSYEVVIIGGGVSGCCLAYDLARMGCSDVLVLEKDYLTAGATGRCGGGIRQQWSTEENVRLAMGSVARFEQLEEELQFPIELKQGGYLILSYTEEEDRRSRKNVALQNSLGLDSRYITPQDALEIFPLLNIDGVVSATFNQSDGTANPFWITQAYALNARELGADIVTGVEVKDIHLEDGRVTGVDTTRGHIKANWVVNAAGARSTEMAAKVGVTLPNKPYRHEILATEVIKPCMDPMVICFSTGIYFSQTARGEIVGGIGDPLEQSSFNTRGSLRFMERMSREVARLVPTFTDLGVVRQWAGLYDVTPDARPVLGNVPGIENFPQMNGYSGHGFMIGPMCSQVTAELIIHGKTKTMDISALNVDRFEDMSQVKEMSVVG